MPSGNARPISGGGADGDAVAAPVKPPSVGQNAANSGVTVGKYAAGAGITLATIYGIIMIIPKAVGSAFFPFLPEEYQPIASCCSVCSSCCCVLAILLLLLTSRLA